MRQENLVAHLQEVCERSSALVCRTAQQRNRISRELHQYLVDIEVRTTRAVLLDEARRRAGTAVAVLFDPEFLTVADETTAVEAVLRAALSVTDCCDLRLCDHRDGAPRLRAHHGLPAAFTTVTTDPTACTALATGEPVLVDDVTRSPIFDGQPIRDVLVAAGLPAVVAHPLRTADDATFGVLTFRFHRPRSGPGDDTARLARGAALALRRFVPAPHPATVR